MCRVTEGLKEKKKKTKTKMHLDVQERRKTKCYYYNNMCSWWVGVTVCQVFESNNIYIMECRGGIAVK